MIKLYVVYGPCKSVYIVKANNKREAVNLAYKDNPGDFKKDFTAMDLEKEFFHADNFDRSVVMLC